MDLQQLENLEWCKTDWCLPSMTKETKKLLRQCINLTQPDVTDDVDEIIKKSQAFSIPFPIETVRLHHLKERRPVEKLQKNIASTYPIIHERVLLLMTHFLNYKREFGSTIEKEFYTDISIPDFVDRILRKRAVCFVGSRDKYLLLTGEKGVDGWDLVGTLQQKPPLVLENCLSYDEIKLAAMVYISGHTVCINNGSRRNAGVIAQNVEEDSVIIGVVGPRFHRKWRMDYEDMLLTEEQNIWENGYGEEVTPNCFRTLKNAYLKNDQFTKHKLRQMWSEFYEVHNYAYEELTSNIDTGNKSEDDKYLDRYVPCNVTRFIFDNEIYYKRLSIIADTALLEADYRAKEAGKNAFLNIIGAGLGVWRISSHQPDVYILTFLERIRSYLDKGLLNHVSDVNFAYILPTSGILSLFTCEDADSKVKRLFFEYENHPKGGINVRLEDREPSSKLTGDDEGKLLVMTYPWDGNAHPGNEFWFGSLTSSGDPAAACSTQVAELHNAHINPFVNGNNVRVAGKHGLKTLSEYCASLITEECK